MQAMQYRRCLMYRLECYKIHKEIVPPCPACADKYMKPVMDEISGKCDKIINCIPNACKNIDEKVKPMMDLVVGMFNKTRNAVMKCTNNTACVKNF